MISNCGHDENGQYSGGKAGDQTGTEWQVVAWYNRPWGCVLRHPNTTVQNDLAYVARAAANNDRIGYDQDQRDTYWTQLSKCNYDPAKITVACEADCSSGVAANVKAVGYRKNIAALKNVSSGLTTRNMKSALTAAGFQLLTDSKYLTSADYLRPGDILLNEGNHTATNLDLGSKAGGDESYRFYPDAVYSGCRGTSVYLAQEILKARGFKGSDGNELKLDRDCGANTVYAINSYQTLRRSQGKELGTNGKNDGSCGNAMWEDLLALPKEGGKYVPATIKVGSTGTSVLLVQEILKARGFYTGSLSQKFDAATMNAVNAYQVYRKKQGVTIGNGKGNGICDAGMWRDLIAI